MFSSSITDKSLLSSKSGLSRRLTCPLFVSKGPTPKPLSAIMSSFRRRAGLGSWKQNSTIIRWNYRLYNMYEERTHLQDKEAIMYTLLDKVKLLTANKIQCPKTYKSISFL